MLAVTRSSAYRLLFTLAHLGFVAYDAGTKTYALGPQVLAPGLRLSRGARHCRSGDAASGAFARPHRLVGASRRIARAGMSSIWRAWRRAARSPAPSMSARACRRGPRPWAEFCCRVLRDEAIRELYRDEPISHEGKRRRCQSWPNCVDRWPPTRQRLGGAERDYEPGVASIAAPIRDMTGAHRRRGQHFRHRAADHRGRTQRPAQD